MEEREVLEQMRRGLPVLAGSPGHQVMHDLAQEALKTTMELNSRYHTPEEVRALFSQLTGKPVDEGFSMFPPFTPTAEKISPWVGTCSSTPAAAFRIRAASPLGTGR